MMCHVYREELLVRFGSGKVTQYYACVRGIVYCALAEIGQVKNQIAPFTSQAGATSSSSSSSSSVPKID